MNTIHRIVACVVLAGLLIVPFMALAKAVPPLAAPPLGERWYSIYMGDERTGFAHSTISMSPGGGYEVSNDGSVRMLVLGFAREASSRETYLVNPDLSLRSFAVEQVIDGSPMQLKGEVTAKGVIVKVEAAGSTREKILKTRGAVYPPVVLNLYPLMLGATPGKKYRVQMLDVEEVKTKDVTITVIGKETIPGGVETIHLRNDLYPVDNDIWVDLAGNTVKESVRDGLIVTSAEEGSVTRQFILDAALAKRDLVLDFSLVRVDRPIEKPLELKRMVLELSGFPDAVPLLSGGGQKAARLDGSRVLYTIESSLDSAEVAPFAVDSPENRKYLEPTDRILSDNSELITEEKTILGTEKDPLKAVEKLTRWVAAHVEESVTDSQTSLETLRDKKGNCQSHARLYAALARAAGVPTRFVSGLVYVTGKGFLYHSWAESYLGRWIAVDPTFGQIPADATHVKLVEGDSPGEMAALAGIIGRIKAKIVEETY